MSYILEALRRAERERDTGKAPSVESLSRGVVEVERTRAPLSVWILAIATAVIASAALAILLWPHPRAAAPTPQAIEPAAAPRPVPQSAPTPVQASLSAAPSPAPTTIEDRDDVVSLDDVTGDATGAATSPDNEAPAPTPTPTPALEPEDTATATSTGPSAAPAAAANPPAPASARDTDQGTIMVPAGVTVLREMPASYREQFPVRTLDVHVYDPDPAKRWVMVDGKRYREGNTLASGAQIEQIIEAGVVFDFQGARVLLPVR